MNDLEHATHLAALEAEQIIPVLRLDYGKLVDIALHYGNKGRWADAESELRKEIETAFYKAIKESK